MIKYRIKCMLPSELSIYGYKRPHIFPVEFNPLGNHMIRLSEHQFESLYQWLLLAMRTVEIKSESELWF